MISGALRPTHASSNLHFIQVTAPDNDVVNKVSVFGPNVHQRNLVHVTELEGGVFSGLTQFRSVGDRYYSRCQHHDDQ